MDRISVTGPPTVFVLFGATGDLAHRKIVPALYQLFARRKLPEQFMLVGVGRSDNDSDSLAESFRGSVEADAQDDTWQTFADKVQYLRGDVTDSGFFSRLADTLNTAASEWDKQTQFIFYLSTTPDLYVPITSGLAEAGFGRGCESSRLVVEKPLGWDLQSFREINKGMREGFDEQQILRTDHFLGKETVQNIIALRFANPIFEPIWNRSYVDSVVITIAEDLGVGRRASYYEKAGALRDMVQNHLFQILCLIALEPPASYEPDDLRDKKMDVLHALRPVDYDEVPEYAVRGQYGPGQIGGESVSGYRQDEGVDDQSNTETYAALKLFIDNWRWQGVPFYLRTGKRMHSTVHEVSIRFRDVPHCFFPNCEGLNQQPTRLVLQLKPEQGVVLKFMAKEPSTTMTLQPVKMRFSYAETFQKPIPDAYETLLADVLVGDATLFMRTDQVEAAWRFLGPILQYWQDNPPDDFPNYAAGTWGPEAGEELMTKDNRHWLTPTLNE